MTETLDSMADEVDQKQLAEQLLAQAKEQGVELMGPNGLLNQLTKNVLETALDAEMTEHLGYEKHDSVGRGSGNSRNGTRSKTVLTEIGPVEIEVPRDLDSSFTPQIVKKRQRRLTGIDEIVLSLTAMGLTTGEVSAHFQDIYGAMVSKDTISRITDKVAGEMTEWQNRLLDRVYPVIFVDAVHVKVRDGQVTNRPMYVAIGVTVNGERDILGIWAGEGGERYRRAVRARGHFPTEQAALKCLYLATRALDPTGKGKARWAMRWKPALNAFAITFEGRITPNGN
jgi:putative transposase